MVYNKCALIFLNQIINKNITKALIMKVINIFSNFIVLFLPINSRILLTKHTFCFQIIWLEEEECRIMKAFLCIESFLKKIMNVFFSILFVYDLISLYIIFSSRWFRININLYILLWVEGTFFSSYKYFKWSRIYIKCYPNCCSIENKV